MSNHKYTEWKIWNGGECPVPEGTRGQVLFAMHNRADAKCRVPFDLSAMGWDHYGHGGDIIAYRVLIEPNVKTVRVKIDTYFYCPPMYLSDVRSYLLTDDPDGVALTYIDGKLTRIFWEADE